MKRIIKKTMPFVLAVLIVFQTIYTSVQTAQAAAIPEVLYYTYWDLINTIYATCGYDSKVDKSVVNNHGVTGKQAWSNFVTFVENSAKANYKFIGDGMSKAFSELENLVNTATEKGISMTQDLYDMLKSVFADQVISENNSLTRVMGGSGLSKHSVVQLVASICGTSVSSVPIDYIYTEGTYLNIIRDSDGFIKIFWSLSPISHFTDGHMIYLNGQSCGAVYGVGFNKGRYSTSEKIYPLASDVFLVKNTFVWTDTISAQVSEGACPKEVPEVVPWRKEVTVPDEWRKANPKKDPDKDPKDDPEVLPVWLPIKPLKPDKPDSTEDPNKKPDSTEDPDKKNDPDKKKDPVVNPIINPSTGNVVDPNTGLDIDPATGKLIDPDTGELIDPDMSDSVNKVNKYGDITKLFPFCIPFDLVKLIKGMSAEKAPPVFHFEHKFKGINYTFVVDVDLSYYDKYIKVFRFGLQVIFVITLMFLTVKFSKLFS